MDSGAQGSTITSLSRQVRATDPSPDCLMTGNGIGFLRWERKRQFHHGKV